MELLKFTAGQIRDGGRCPNWKRLKHYNSAAPRSFYLKLSTLMHYRPLCHRPSGNRSGYRSTRGLTTDCACWCTKHRSSRRRRTSPTCWHLSVSSVQSLSTQRSATNGDYIVQRTRRKLGESTFSVAAPRAWNRLLTELTRNSSGDEIANVNFLFDDIVHALKYNRLLHKFRYR